MSCPGPSLETGLTGLSDGLNWVVKEPLGTNSNGPTHIKIYVVPFYFLVNDVRMARTFSYFPLSMLPHH